MALAYVDERTRFDEGLPADDAEEKRSVELHAFPAGKGGPRCCEASEMIVATAGDGLRTQGDAVVEVICAAVADPQEVARLLRAMAESLEGPNGKRAVSLQPVLGLCDATPNMQTFNDRADFLHWRDEQE